MLAVLDHQSSVMCTVQGRVNILCCMPKTCSLALLSIALLEFCLHSPTLQVSLALNGCLV
jgi:hypothetical protein